MSTYGFRDDHKSKFQKSYFYLCSPTLWICSRPLTWTILNAQTGSDPYNIHWVFSLPFSGQGIMKPKETVSLLGKETPVLNSTGSPIYWLYNCACSVAQSCPTFCDPMDCSPPSSSIHGTSPGEQTRAGCHFLLQGIFVIQRLNPQLLLCPLHWQADSELPESRLCNECLQIHYFI